MQIREFEIESDMEGLRECVISVQDYERNLDPRMPDGAGIVDAYVVDLFKSCQRFQGKILVALSRESIPPKVVGYVLVLTAVTSESIEDGDIEYGLIRDLVVLENHRGQGIGSKLLKAAENEARKQDARWLRIEVLDSNEAAKQLYLSRGFQPYTLLLEKEL